MRFRVEQVKIYRGPNLVLPTKAVVFRLLVPRGAQVEALRQGLSGYLSPVPDASSPAELFAQVMVQVLKLDMDLAVEAWRVIRAGDHEYQVGVQILDEPTGEDALYLTLDLFNDVHEGKRFPFEREFARLQKGFDRSLYGGPTIYSLIEAGMKAGIPMVHLPQENVFQWGYGRRQVRGRSTTLSIDSIKDTEFTCYKDMVKEFLQEIGLPTPRGSVCHDLRQALRVAQEIGYPVVVKPVAGHKGQGVTTHIQHERELERAFNGLLASGVRDGIIVERHVTGFDHRLLTVGGRFVAALKREPAFVVGDGEHTIGQLIEKENETFARRDNARSPLTKIRIDDDLIDYLRLQDLSLSSVIKKGRKVFLRRVANISAGGVSINVTDEIHEDNKRLAEDVASFLKVHCLGIDVLAEDIGLSWKESPLAIIEINAGPGVFMHLAPAIGGSVDVPGTIMRSLFPTRRHSRIPLMVFDTLSPQLAKVTTGLFKRPGVVVGVASREGLFIDDRFVAKAASQWQRAGSLLRHQSLDVGILEYPEEDILEDGLRYHMADVVVLMNPSPVQRVLARDIEPDGWLVVSARAWSGDAPEGVRVYVVDEGAGASGPEGVGLVRLEGRRPVLHEGEVMPLPDPAPGLPTGERLVAAALAHVAPTLLERFALAR